MENIAWKEVIFNHKKFMTFWKRHSWVQRDKNKGQFLQLSSWEFRFNLAVILQNGTPLQIFPPIWKKDRIKQAFLSENGVLKPYINSGINFTLRQNIPKYYHKNGICYAATRNAIMKDKEIFGDSCVGVVIERPVVNIDDETELELAEYYLNKINKQ